LKDDAIPSIVKSEAEHSPKGVFRSRGIVQAAAYYGVPVARGEIRRRFSTGRSSLYMNLELE